MIFEEQFTKIVNFMTPRAGVLVLGRGYLNHVNMHQFFKKSFILMLSIDQTTEYIVMIIKEGFIKIVNSISPRAGLYVLWRV